MAYDTKLSLNQRLLNVMLEVEYVKKDVSIPGSGKGVARDAVVAAIRRRLLANGVIARTSEVPGTGRFIETNQKSASGTPKITYAATYRTSFVNVDDGSTVDVEHLGQGDDFGDKAPGKAGTYAEKLNFLRGLLLETGIADEGRNPGEGDTDTESGPVCFSEAERAVFEGKIKAETTEKAILQDLKDARQRLAVVAGDIDVSTHPDMVALIEVASKRKGELAEAKKAEAKKAEAAS